MAGSSRIIVLSEQFRGQSFELTEERYTIGRGENCGICLPDPTISSHHCTLQRLPDDGYEIIDEGSTNGSRVNGVRTKQQKLVNSDIIQAGAIEMLFDSDVKNEGGAASTQTGIDLQTSAGTTVVSDVHNVSPFQEHSELHGGRGGFSSLLTVGIIALLVLAALVIMVMVILNLF